MPEIGGTDLATLRQIPVLGLRGRYISVAEREVVFSGQINGTPNADVQTFGYFSFVYDNATGTYTDVLEGMTVDFGSTPGARDIASVRVRATPTTNTFFIPESAPAALPIYDDCYFTVIREFRPWVKIPRGVATQTNSTYTNGLTMYMDYDIGYAHQNTFMRPKVNITRSSTTLFAPKPSAFVDGYGTASPEIFRTMTFSCATSFTLSVGHSVSLIVWDVVDGTITVGNEFMQNITVQFPVGFRYISCDVEGSDGIHNKMYYPIWVHDDDYFPLVNFKAPNRNTTADFREMEIEFTNQDTDESVIPKGVPICYWEIPDFGASDIPETYRDEFLGYCSEDTTLFKKYAPTDTLIITGLGGWLARSRGFSQRVSDPLRAPNSWFEMEDITLDKLVLYLLDNFTSATQIANLFLSGVEDNLKSLDITLGNVWQQVQYIVSGYYGKAKSDSFGSIWLNIDYSHLTQEHRDEVDVVMNLTSADWQDSSSFKLTRRNYQLVGWLTGPGASFNGTDNTLFNSAAPGRTPGDADQQDQAPFQNLPYTDPQATLNILTGFEYAYRNNQYPNVSVQLLYNMDVFEPAWNEPVLITATDSRSGLTITDFPFIVKSVDVTYNDFQQGPAKTVTLTMEGATIGDPAQTEPVEADQTPTTDYEPPVDIVIQPTVVTPDSLIPDETGQLPIKGVVLAGGGAKCGLATSFNPSTGVITYNDISTGLSGNGIWYCSDPYNYFRGYALTSDGLYRCNDVETFTTWTLVADNTALFGSSGRYGHFIMSSHLRQGWFMILSGTNTAVVTTNNWSTYTKVSINGLTNDYDSGYVTDGKDCSASLLGHNTNHLIAVAPWNSATYIAAMYRSNDGGLTWSLFKEFFSTSGTPLNRFYAEYPRVIIDIPYKRSSGANNTDDSNLEIAIWASGDVHFSGKQDTIAVTVDNAVSWPIGIVFPTSSSSGGAVPVLRPSTFFTNNSTYSWMYSDSNIVKSTNHLTSVSANLINMITITGVNGWPMNHNVAIAWSTRASTGQEVKFTTDGGLNWYGTRPVFFPDDNVAYAEFSLFPFITNRG